MLINLLIVLFLFTIEFGPVVENNPKLADAIENAKKNNVPTKSIQFARKISCVSIL